MQPSLLATLNNAPWWMPPNAALHGFAVDRLLRLDLIAMGACLVLAHALLLIALLRRNRSGRQSGASLWRAEGIPLVLLSVLFTYMTYSAHRLWARDRFEGPSPTALTVEIVGQQFQWYFHYPGLDATFGSTKPTLVSAAYGNPLGLDPADPHSADDLVASELVLPAGREVDLQLRAHDVIHGFFVPAMRLKQNAVPGLTLHVHFTPVTVGTYPILCSQVCGLGHFRMEARLRVVPPAEYAAWIAQKEAARQRSAEAAR